MFAFFPTVMMVYRLKN